VPRVALRRVELCMSGSSKAERHIKKGKAGVKRVKKKQKK
jgi:hypothetical protein